MQTTTYAAWEKVVLGSKSGMPVPILDGLACRWRDLELHRPLSLLLHNNRPSGNVIAMASGAHAQANQVAGAQLAVDA
jgi:hypothetical protein